MCAGALGNQMGQGASGKTSTEGREPTSTLRCGKRAPVQDSVQRGGPCLWPQERGRSRSQDRGQGQEGGHRKLPTRGGWRGPDASGESWYLIHPLLASGRRPSARESVHGLSSLSSATGEGGNTQRVLDQAVNHTASHSVRTQTQGRLAAHLPFLVPHGNPHTHNPRIRWGDGRGWEKQRNRSPALLGPGLLC